MNRTQIREIFLRNGFSIKPGCDDLKTYVYAAAEELLNLAEVERLGAMQGELVGYVNPQLLPLLGSKLEGLMVRKSKTANRTLPLYATPLTASEESCMSNQNVQPDVSKLNTSEYIHKQKTHIVNGVEIPDLRVTPEHGDSYYLVDPTVPELATLYKFTGTVIDKIWVERGLAYQPTEEGKQAAILHAKAMLGVATGAATMNETGDGGYVSAEAFGTLQAQCDALVEALEKYESAFNELFVQCCSNPITNAWGKPVSVAALNDAHAFASSRLAAHRKGGDV